MTTAYGLALPVPFLCSYVFVMAPPLNRAISIATRGTHKHWVTLLRDEGRAC